MTALRAGRSRVSNPVAARNICSLQEYLNRPRCEADRSPLRSAGIKNEWRFASTPLYALMVIARRSLHFCLLLTFILAWKCPGSHSYKPLYFPYPGCSSHISLRYRTYCCELYSPVKVRRCFTNSVMQEFSAALKSGSGELSETSVTTTNFTVSLAVKVQFYCTTYINSLSALTVFLTFTGSFHFSLQHRCFEIRRKITQHVINWGFSSFFFPWR